MSSIERDLNHIATWTMTGPDGDQNRDNSSASANAAAIEAINNAARAYASLAPNAGAPLGAFPPLSAVDASAALLMNPAAAVAAVAAAAAKQLAAAQGHIPMQAPIAGATATPALVAALGPPPHGMSVNHSHAHAPTASNPQSAAMAAASSFLPTAAGASTIPGAATLSHVSALLQSVGQQVTKVQAAQAHHNLAAVAAPSPPPPASYSPTPAVSFSQRSVSEASANPANGHPNAWATAASTNPTVNPVHSSALLPNIQNWSLEQLGA